MEFHKESESMDKQACCSGKKDNDPACESGDLLLYWCETCQRQVAEKRCPGCGLKCRKRRNV